MVEKELGKPIDEIFSKWSDEPIAAASLAQVNIHAHVVCVCARGCMCVHVSLCACLPTNVGVHLLLMDMHV